MTASPLVGFRIEGGSGGDVKSWSISDMKIEQDVLDTVYDNSQNDYEFYRNEFLDNPNRLNYLGNDLNNGPIAASIIPNADKSVYKSLVQTKSRNHRFEIKTQHVIKTWWRRFLNLEPSTFEILKSLSPSNFDLSNAKLITDPRYPQALLNLEDRQTLKGFKIGLLYALGQQNEDEIYANERGSADFEDFLDDIGTRVNLKDFPHYHGGLDVKDMTSGKQSLYTKYNNNQIMYHVGTLLPHNPKDKQQLEKKRHIGNDFVVVVFQEGNAEFRPNTLASKQNHAFLLVRAVRRKNSKGIEKKYYQMSVVTKDGVPAHLPEIPPNVLFRRGDKFRKYFYTKLLNLEFACYKAPTISTKLTRARLSLLTTLIETFFVR